MADRYYCPDPPVAGRITLGPEEARHMVRVRRVEVGEVVEVFDGRGMGYRAEVQGLGKDRVEVRVLETVPDRLASLSLTLASAVPKGERFDWLVEKATELGVRRLVPLRTERSTVDPRGSKLDRLRRVVIEAAKQCGRNRLMVLDDPVDWLEFLDQNPRSTSTPTLLVAHPGGPPIQRAVLGLESTVTLAIGPEGGFTDKEALAARDRGGRVVGLGPTLLRIETAGLAGCATLLALTAKD